MAASVARSSSFWRPALCLGLFGMVALGVLGALSRRESIPRGDDLIYERMAQHPSAVHTFPFAYRVGLPWLVHVLPFSHTLSFELLACVGAGGAAGFAFILMRRLGTPEGLAAGLALALAISPPMLIVVLREGRNTDAVTMLFMMAGTLFVVERRLRALTVTLVVGVLFREAVLFVIPFAYLLWATRVWDVEVAKRAVLVGAPAVLLFVVLHLAIPSVGRASVPGYGSSLIDGRVSVVESGIDSLLTEARRMFSIYGPLWLAAPLALFGSRFARRGLVFVACALISMTYALDWGRMIFLAAPVFYPAGAYTLTRHSRWRVPALAAFGVLSLGYAIYMDRSGVQHGIINNPPPPYPVR